MNIFIKTNDFIKKVESFEIRHIEKDNCFLITDEYGDPLLNCLDIDICHKVINRIWNKLERYVDHDYGDLCIDLDELVKQINDEERGELAF